jgi:hypothetical protein
LSCNDRSCKNSSSFGVQQVVFHMQREWHSRDTRLHPVLKVGYGFDSPHPLSSFLLWQSKFSPQARARVTFIPTRFMAYKLVIATNTETVLRPVK